MLSLFQSRPYWEKHGSRENLLSHVRQASTQSSGSDWASSGYHSMSYHSKQSSCSTEEDQGHMSFIHPYNGLKESASNLDIAMNSVPPPPHEYFYRDLAGHRYNNFALQTQPCYYKCSTSDLGSTNSSSLSNSCGNVKVLVQNLNKRHAINQRNCQSGRLYKKNPANRSSECPSWPAYYSRHSAENYNSSCPSESEAEYVMNGVAFSNESHSNSSTPLLDRLKKERQGDTCLTGEPSHRSSNSFDSGAESIGSCNSSQETLKWHGSTSDLTFCVVSSKPPGPYGSDRPSSPSSSGPASWSHPVDVSHVQSPRFGPPKQSGLVRSPSHTKESSPIRPKNFEVSLYKAKPISIDSDHEIWRGSSMTSSTKESNPRSPPPGQLVGHTLTVKPSNHSVVHSSRVLQPQRQNSHSIMYYNNSRSSNGQYVGGGRKSSYVSDPETCSVISHSSIGLPSLEYASKTLYLDPVKKTKVTDPELKAIQKQAVLSFFERRNSNNAPSPESGDEPTGSGSKASSPSATSRTSIYANESEIQKVKSVFTLQMINSG